MVERRSLFKNQQLNSADYTYQQKHESNNVQTTVLPPSPFNESAHFKKVSHIASPNISSINASAVTSPRI